MEPKFSSSRIADGSTILRIEGPWDKSIANAIETLQFDGLQVDESIGSYEHLIPFASKIKWLFGPSLINAGGLSKLTCIEKVTLLGGVNLDFDYRVLPQLKSLHISRVMTPFPVQYLNNPSLERLAIEGLKVKDLRFLGDCAKLRALKLTSSPIQSMAGIENLLDLRELKILQNRSLADISHLSNGLQIESLEIEDTAKVLDISPLYGLVNLRWLYINSKKANQRDLSWLSKMPQLECAEVMIETAEIDLNVFAEHPLLYDIAFYSNRNFVIGSDDEIATTLSRCGRKVKKISRYPKDLFPAFAFEFQPAEKIVKPMPRHVYKTNLRY
jgi:hypothetical protein